MRDNARPRRRGRTRCTALVAHPAIRRPRSPSPRSARTPAAGPPSRWPARQRHRCTPSRARSRRESLRDFRRESWHRESYQESRHKVPPHLPARPPTDGLPDGLPDDLPDGLPNGLPNGLPEDPPVRRSRRRSRAAKGAAALHRWAGPRRCSRRRWRPPRPALRPAPAGGAAAPQVGWHRGGGKRRDRL